MSLQITSIPILKYKNENCITVADDVAIEEPLEISIAYLQNQQLVFKIINFKITFIDKQNRLID